MRKILTILVALASSVTLSAQDVDAPKSSEAGQFSGKPIVTIFANHHSGLGNEVDNSGFALDRVYLGYGFSFKDQLSGSVIFDVASTKVEGSKLDYVAHVKNAYLTWKRDDFSLNFGLIKTNNFGYQEKFWGHRYLMKSFKDEYGFAPSADLGISAGYAATSWLDLDVSFTNGEGNKRLVMDNNYRYGLGATFKATKELSFRAYYDLYTANGKGADKHAEQTFTLFAGYKHSLFSIGGEYVYRTNMDFTAGVDYNGLSVFSNVKLIDKLSLFGRYDYITSSVKDAGDMGSAVRAGVEYAPFKFLKFSPNVYSWSPEVGDTETYIYLSLLVKF